MPLTKGIPLFQNNPNQDYCTWKYPNMLKEC